jgi:predicted dehydrogenase
MARTPEECDRMIEACDRAGVKLAVAHQMRISPVLEYVKQSVAQGMIGQLQEMRGRGKEDKRAGGEDLMVLGTHIFDLMRQFAGDPLWAFGRVTAAGTDVKRRDMADGPEGLGPIAGDSIAGVYAFRDGLTGYFGTRRSDEASGKRWGLDLFGSRGMVTIRAAPEEPVVHVSRSVEWTAAPWERLTLPGNPPPRDIHGANAALVTDLLEAIEQNREPKAGGRHARWTIEMAMALYESQRTGARAPFPLKNRGNPLAS